MFYLRSKRNMFLLSLKVCYNTCKQLFPHQFFSLLKLIRQKIHNKANIFLSQKWITTLILFLCTYYILAHWMSESDSTAL